MSQRDGAFAGAERPYLPTYAAGGRGNDLYATIGGLRSVLEPYTEPETARVEMTPGTGEVLRFAFADDGTVKELRWNDETFVRAK